MVDEVFRYEQLGAEMERLARIVGLPDVPALPRAKGNTRTDRRPYSEVLSDEDRRRVAEYYNFEIDYLRYDFHSEP